MLEIGSTLYIKLARASAIIRDVFRVCSTMLLSSFLNIVVRMGLLGLFTDDKVNEG